MSERYARELLRRNVAQICQTIGWNGIQSTPLDVLVHVLEKYVRTLGTESARRAELLGRTDPNLHDLGLVFRDLQVHLPELSEYVRSVPPAPCLLDVERFPHPKESHLNFLKPGSHEVVTRPVHVHEHLPPMYPEKELTLPIADTVEVRHNGLDSPGDAACVSPEISVTDSPEKKDPFKRPPDPMPLPPSKRPRLKLEEEECHTREISSVMMTMSGFLSPAREGKLPEAAAPALPAERHSDKHKVNSHHSNLMRVPSMQASLERSEKKSKKSRLVNGKIMKSKKKDKHRSDSSKSRHDRMDRLPPEQLHKNKEIPPLLQNHNALLAPRVVPPSPTLDNIRPIKQEPLDLHPLPVRHNPVGELNTIPTPRKIPINKSPLVPSALTHSAKPMDISKVIVPPVEIKKEIIDDDEKLASQPDRSKLNIFKRISNKSKEEKTTSEINERCHGESSSHRTDNMTPLSLVKSNAIETATRMKPQTLINNNSEGAAMDLSSRQMDLTTNEVINIDDDSLEMNSSYIKPDPDSIPTPVPVPVNKLNQLPYPKDMTIPPKVKKERKHKEKRDKAAEKAAKLMRKQETLALAAQSHNMTLQSIPTQFTPKTKSPKLGRPLKSESSKFPQMPPNFPFFPSVPGRGLIPGPGLIPNPLIPGNDLYVGLANNPALRGLPPNLLANPFALGGPGLIPGTRFMHGPGMVPTGFLGNFRQAPRAQQPRFPLLRRPSLEVIAVDNDEARKPPLSQISPLREKDKSEKHKIPTIPNILQKHSPQKNRHAKDTLSKTSTYKMPTVTPDVTIQLNPPVVKPEIIKTEPPPTIDTVPVSAPRVPLPDQLPETSITEISKEKSKVDNEKKREKLHKKEKKEKDGIKVKRKKDKKDKNKVKSEKRKDKEERVEGKDKIKKEKKEKKKDKERPPAAVDALVPKLTLKLGSASPMAPSSPETFKLNIKPIKKESPDSVPITPKEERTSRESSRSPELAQISALVTRPPKPKVSKHNHLPPEQITDVKAGSPPPQTSNSSPPRKNRPPSSHSKYKRILFKPLSKRSNVVDEDPSIDLVSEEPQQPPGRTSADKSAPTQLSTPYYTDEHGNKVWVCPACGRPDNGSPMIGCDGCDCWYHWVCVGITVDPGVSEDWFCKSCVAKRAAMVTALAGVQTGRKRGRKPKADRVKDGH